MGAVAGGKVKKAEEPEGAVRERALEAADANKEKPVAEKRVEDMTPEEAVKADMDACNLHKAFPPKGPKAPGGPKRQTTPVGGITPGGLKRETETKYVPQGGGQPGNPAQPPQPANLAKPAQPGQPQQPGQAPQGAPAAGPKGQMGLPLGKPQGQPQAVQQPNAAQQIQQDPEQPHGVQAHPIGEHAPKDVANFLQQYAYTPPEHHDEAAAQAEQAGQHALAAAHRNLKQFKAGGADKFLQAINGNLQSHHAQLTGQLSPEQQHQPGGAGGQEQGGDAQNLPSKGTQEILNAAQQGKQIVSGPDAGKVFGENGAGMQGPEGQPSTEGIDQIGKFAEQGGNSPKMVSPEIKSKIDAFFQDPRSQSLERPEFLKVLSQIAEGGSWEPDAGKAGKQPTKKGPRSPKQQVVDHYTQNKPEATFQQDDEGSAPRSTNAPADEVSGEAYDKINALRGDPKYQGLDLDQKALIRKQVAEGQEPKYPDQGNLSDRKKMKKNPMKWLKEKRGSVKKSFTGLDGLEDYMQKASGEGSRGGKIIGHTKSGKIVYAIEQGSDTVYHVLPINRDDALATLVEVDSAGEEIGERTRIPVGDLNEFYIVYDVNMKPITAKIVESSLKTAIKAIADASELNEEDIVIITGPVTGKGETGKIDSFGIDKKFVVVKLDNGDRRSYHSGDVSAYEPEEDEDEDDEDDEFEASKKSAASKCKNFLKGSGVCRTGCKSSKIIAMNACPWDGDWDDAEKECKCYK